MQFWARPILIIASNAVNPVLRDHCHERPPVLKDQILLAEGPTFVIEPDSKDHLS